MYAISDQHGIYHLLESEKKTLCGLSVIPTVLPKGADAPLHLVKDIPTDFRLCQHCERIKSPTEE